MHARLTKAALGSFLVAVVAGCGGGSGGKTAAPQSSVSVAPLATDTARAGGLPVCDVMGTYWTPRGSGTLVHVSYPGPAQVTVSVGGVSASGTIPAGMTGHEFTLAVRPGDVVVLVDAGGRSQSCDVPKLPG